MTLTPLVLTLVWAAAEPAQVVAVLPLQARPAAASIVDAADALLVASVGKAPGRKAIGRGDISAMIGDAKLQQSLSCDSLQCVADIGAALSASHVVAGTLSRLGGSVVLTLALIDVKSARVDKRARVEAATASDLLAAAIDGGVRDLFYAREARSTLVVSLEEMPPPAWFCADTTTGTDVCARGWLQCNVEARAWGGEHVECKQAERVFCQARGDASERVETCHASLSACRHWGTDASVMSECEPSDQQWALGTTP